MQSEQPLITICEICGGAHPTSTHTDTSENPQEKKQTQEEEPNHEAMEKVVDIFTTEDLKYRYRDPIITSLETGIPTPSTDFLRQPFGRLDKTAREKMKHANETLEQERNNEDDKLMYGRSKRANVFYPEGLLKVIRDQVLGTKNVELWSKNYLGHGSLYGTGINLAIMQLRRTLSSLPKHEQEKISQLTGHSEQHISDILKNRDDQPVNFDETKEVKEILKTLLSDPVVFEILRLAWLKRFFTNDTNRNHGTDDSLTPSGFMPTHGLVLSPQTNVAVSPCDDFPTQATVLSPRIKPKDFIGLFVSNQNQSMYIAGQEAIDLDDDILTHDQKLAIEKGINLYDDVFFNPKKLPVQTQLEQAIFRMPNQPIEYLFEYYARPFLVFLEKQGFEREKLETYFHHFSSILNAEDKAYTYTKEFSKNRVARRKILLERAITLADKLRTALTEDTYKELETFAKKFIEEKSPVKDGETLWTGFTRLAERHQLPIYNLAGELLWPKKMTHEQVAQFVAQKTETNK